jgi:hypothetical protein
MTPKATSPAAIAPSHSTGADMKQWRRPQRSALSVHPVPIHANARVHMRPVCGTGRCQKFVDIPRAIGSAHQTMMPIGWRDQSLDLAGSRGAQLVVSVIPRSPATAPTAFVARQLNGRARHGAVRTEHAAIAGFGSQHRAAHSALEKIDAGIHRHDLTVSCATEWADQFRTYDRDARRCCRRHLETAAGPMPSIMACTLAVKTRASRCGYCGVFGSPPS